LVRTSKKARKTRVNKDFYTELKKSVTCTAIDTLSKTLSIETYVEQDSIEKSEIMIDAIFVELNKTKKFIIEFSSILGIELANLKLLCYYAKCDKCAASADKYVILSCKRCNSSSNVDSYFSDVKSKLQYSDVWINFLIRIGRLCKLYPKFKYVTLPLNQIQKQISKLPMLVENDIEFWRT
jgi:hypothetical protein